MPALPDPFPDYCRNFSLPLGSIGRSLGYGELKLWIYGGTCSGKIAGQLRSWRYKLVHELEVTSSLPKDSKHERLALLYFFEVLLLDTLKDAILKDGPKDAATSLCVRAIPVLQFS